MKHGKTAELPIMTVTFSLVRSKLGTIAKIDRTLRQIIEMINNWRNLFILFFNINRFIDIYLYKFNQYQSIYLVDIRHLRYIIVVRLLQLVFHTSIYSSSHRLLLLFYGSSSYIIFSRNLKKRLITIVIKYQCN